MINRQKRDHIGIIFDKGIEYHFYFDAKEDEDGRKLVTAIFNLNGNMLYVARALIDQLHDELKDVCRTELVKQVFIDIRDVYYPYDNEDNQASSTPRPSYVRNSLLEDINMDFYTDYLIKKEEREGIISDVYWGYYCCTTLGRFSRKDRKFYEVSNSMLSKCELMS